MDFETVYQDEMLRSSMALESMLEHTGIRSIYGEECAHVRADLNLFKKVCEMEARFVNKKEEHIQFFGGNLTGVHVVRFAQDDFDIFFDEILEIDEVVLSERIWSLPDINREYKISSNIFNISCVWLMHLFANSPYLSEEQKLEAQVRVALYLNYRFYTSISFWFFKYPANPETAAATYAQLSNRFLLKACGSWGATLRRRSLDIVSEGSIWHSTIAKLNDDYAVVKMLNDIQGRIKDIVKNIYSVFVHVHQQGTKISTSSTLIETDGELIMRDRVKGPAVYTRYIRGVIPDKNSFVRYELQQLVTNVVPTAPTHYFDQTLAWVSSNFNYLSDRKLESTVELIMEHAFDYLSENRQLLKRKDDIQTVLLKLRGTYTSSRATDAKLMAIKEQVEDVVRVATKSKNGSAIAAVRTAFCLYVVIRAFTKDHYQRT